AGVAHGPERQPLGRREVAGPGPLAPADDPCDLPGLLPAEADRDHRADDAADHLVAEGRGLDLEPELAVAVLEPAGLGHPADQRRLRPVPSLRPAAERGEVVLADEG